MPRHCWRIVLTGCRSRFCYGNNILEPSVDFREQLITCWRCRRCAEYANRVGSEFNKSMPAGLCGLSGGLMRRSPANQP